MDISNLKRNKQGKLLVPKKEFLEYAKKHPDYAGKTGSFNEPDIKAGLWSFIALTEHGTCLFIETHGFEFI